jgi:hypothetical protein
MSTLIKDRILLSELIMITPELPLMFPLPLFPLAPPVLPSPEPPPLPESTTLLDPLLDADAGAGLFTLVCA